MARLTSLIRRQETTPNRTKDARKAFRGLVLHIAQGTYEGTISWQKNPDSNVSSEFVIGRRQGEWAQMMDLDDYGWTQREGNGYWVASENAGFVADGLTDWQVEANAQLLAWLHVHQGVPLQVADHPGERGLGHHSMDREWLGEEWGHDECPGPRVLSRKAEIVARAKQIVNGEDDMQLTDTVHLVSGGDVAYKSPTTSVEGVLASSNYYTLVTRNLVLGLRTEVAAMRAVVEQLASAITTGGGTVDTAAILAGVDQRLAVVRADMRDAVADLGEGGAEQVRATQG